MCEREGEIKFLLETLLVKLPQIVFLSSKPQALHTSLICRLNKCSHTVRQLTEKITRICTLASLFVDWETSVWTANGLPRAWLAWGESVFPEPGMLPLLPSCLLVSHATLHGSCLSGIVNVQSVALGALPPLPLELCRHYNLLYVVLKDRVAVKDKSCNFCIRFPSDVQILSCKTFMKGAGFRSWYSRLPLNLLSPMIALNFFSSCVHLWELRLKMCTTGLYDIGMEARASCMSDKHSTNQVTSWAWERKV